MMLKNSNHPKPSLLKEHKRLLIVFILGFSSGLPLALVGSTLQAWFADAGLSILATGMLSLLGIPHVYRMLWAPVVDHYGLTCWGKRRSWILLMQVLLLVGFNIMAWCSPNAMPKVMALLAFFIAFFSATQDIAIDAHRTEYLPLAEYGLGASLAVLGYRLAMLFSGGLALIFAHYLGWKMTYQVMGLCLIPGMVATLWSPEPSANDVKGVSIVATYCEPLKELIARKGFVALVLFIFFYKLGEAFTASTSGVMMPFLIQGLGFSLEAVGLVNKVVGVIALVLGGLLSGVMLMRWSLYRALFCFGIIQAVTNLLFVALAMSGKNLLLFATAVISDNFAAGMGTTALVVLFMRLVDKRYTATQFSILVSISALPRVLSGPVAALLHYGFGWVGLFQWSFVFALGFIPFLRIVRRADMDRSSIHTHTV